MPGNIEWEDPTGFLEPWFPVALLLDRIKLVYMKNGIQEPHRKEQIQRDSSRKKTAALLLKGQSFTWLKRSAVYLRMTICVSRLANNRRNFSMKFL